MKLCFKILTFLIFVLLFSGEAGANSHVVQPCKPIEAVFARGSGQNLEDQDYANAYKGLISEYTRNTSIAFNHYELGTTHQRGSDGIGYKYPAIPINGMRNGGYQNAWGAIISGGLRNDYGKSVEDGVKELAIYLNQRFTRGGACAESRIILAGYSQGAQVIGQFLAWNSGWLDQSVLDRIDYVALLGDPKTYLPEGAKRWGWFAKPAACLEPVDKYYYRSPYRAEVPDCKTHQGALGGRSPYALGPFQNRVGLWCSQQDPVCDKRWNIYTDGEYHGTYPANGYIEEAVTRSLTRVAMKLDSASKDKLLFSVRNDGQQPPSSGSFYTPYIAAPYIADEVPPTDCKAYIAVDHEQPYLIASRVASGTVPATDLRYQAVELAKRFYGEGCSLAFYDSRNELGSATFAVLQDSTRDLDIINETLNSLTPDAVNQTVYKARCSAGFFDRARYDFVTHIAAEPSNLDTSTRFGVTGGHTLCGRDDDAAQQLQKLYQQQAATGRALSHESITPDTLGVVMYSPEFVDPGSGGFDAGGEIPEALRNRSYELSFDLSRYYALTGQAMTLSVGYENPVATDDEYYLYLWDFDGNGEIDDVTDEPTVTHTYTASGDYALEVYATTVGGTLEEAYAEVMVRNTDAELMADEVVRPAQPSQPKLEDIGNSTLAVTWHPADSLAQYWLIQIGDTPGILVDIGNSSRVEITDMDLSQPIDIRIIGVTEDGYRGEAASASYTPPVEQPPADEGNTTPVDDPAPGRGGIDDSGDTTQNLFTKPSGPSATLASLTSAPYPTDEFISFLASEQSSQPRTLGAISENQSTGQDEVEETSTETATVFENSDSSTNGWLYVLIASTVVAIGVGGIAIARRKGV